MKMLAGGGCGVVVCSCIIGFRRLALVLIREQWDIRTMEAEMAALAHELLHIWRHDNVKNLLLLLFQDAFWFHLTIWPGMTYMRREIECLRDMQISNRTQ